MWDGLIIDWLGLPFIDARVERKAFFWFKLFDFRINPGEFIKEGKTVCIVYLYQ